MRNFTSISPKRSTAAKLQSFSMGLVALCLWFGNLQVGAQPLRAPINDARNVAVAFAITMDLATHSLAASCAPFGGDAAARTQASRMQWTQRNGRLVQAAHTYLRALQAAIASREGREAGQRFYDERKAELQNQTSATLKEMFPPDADAFGTCRKIAIALAARELDLSSKPEHLAELQAIEVELKAAAKIGG